MVGHLFEGHRPEAVGRFGVHGAWLGGGKTGQEPTHQIGQGPEHLGILGRLATGPARCGWWSGDSCGSPRKRGANACTECEYRVSHSEQSHELFWTGQCRSG